MVASTYADPNSTVFKTKHEDDNMVASKYWVRRGLFQRFIGVIGFSPKGEIPTVGYRWV